LGKGSGESVALLRQTSLLEKEAAGGVMLLKGEGQLPGQMYTEGIYTVK
jgi:hypothetical protein